MTLNQLECFTVLAQRLNFTQAADDLFMSQPALSRTILALEQELGVRLFERNSRSVSLTPAGRAFFRKCPDILTSYRASLNAALTAQEGYEGELTVGVLQDYFDPDAVRLYQRMAAACPAVRLELRECSHSDLVRRLLQGELDAVINFGEDVLSPDTEALVLRHDRECAVVHPASPLAAEERLTMAQLKDQPFVVMSRTSSQPGYSKVWRSASAAGFTPQIAAEAELVPTLLMLVACGKGVSTLNENTSYMARSMVKYIPLEDVPPARQALIWRRDNANPSLPLLLEAARGLAEPEPAGSPGPL